MQLDNLQERLCGQGLSREEVLQRLDHIENSVREASRQARSLSHLLVAGDVSPPELPNALSKLVETYQAAVDTDCALSLPVEEVPALLDDTEAGHLYRIAQEALRNAVQHGNPDHVRVALAVQGASSSEEGDPTAGTSGSSGRSRKLVLRIQDDGPGLPEGISTCMTEITAPSSDAGIASPRRPGRRAVSRAEGDCNKEASDDRQAGDGIGLHLMNYRADLIGAHLSVRSEAGEGTVVCCELPLA